MENSKISKATQEGLQQILNLTTDEFQGCPLLEICLIFKCTKVKKLWNFRDFQLIYFLKSVSNFYRLINANISWANLSKFRWVIQRITQFMFKVNNRNNRTTCEKCSKLTIKLPERCQQCRSSVFIVDLLTLNIFHTLF